MNVSQPEPRSYFEGVMEWPEVFQRRAELANRGIRVNVDAIILYALLCDVGGGLGITTRALREAVDRHVSVGGFPFRTRIMVNGMVLMLPDLAPDAPHIDASGRELGAVTDEPTLAEILIAWREEMERFSQDRRKLGDIHGAECIQNCIGRLLQMLSDEKKEAS